MPSTTRVIGFAIIILGLAIAFSPYYRPLKQFAASAGAPPAVVTVGLAAVLLGGWLLTRRRTR